jgi:LysM repeat protein
VTVESGQTLSAIASLEMPGTPVREGVARIQLANGLSSSDVHVGQVLQIPAEG